ncbi:hypothetical protein QOZ80_3BG0287210 [Eleusine coracana subsp. coracana]|nr:hypothetical protein QOZ80_3BG0287210 [Eleusine coracana subsp. coracana]
MAVTFWMANPPELSSFSVYCPQKAPNTLQYPEFKVFPHVVGAEGPFVLLCARFFGVLEEEYFLYKASDSPSLELLPPPHRGRFTEFRDFGIVPCCSGCHYRLIALCNARSGYQLQIYCSGTRTWSTKTLRDPCPGVKIVPKKVISLGKGRMGWVDFSCGILVCDFYQQCASFIPLPVPLLENRSRLKKASESKISARWFRDLTYVKGKLVFVEMEDRFIEAERHIDPRYNVELKDSELIMSARHREMDDKNKTRNGWSAMIWVRDLSTKSWLKFNTIDSNGIKVDESFVLSKQKKRPRVDMTKDFIREMFMYTYSSFPTLSLDGDHLYFKHMLRPNDQNGRVFAVDVGNKTVLKSQLGPPLHEMKFIIHFDSSHPDTYFDMEALRKIRRKLDSTKHAQSEGPRVVQIDHGPLINPFNYNLPCYLCLTP